MDYIWYPGVLQWNGASASSLGCKDNTSINRSYKILGLSDNASLEQVSNQYKKLIKEYHPDKLQGMGLPKEFIELANKKLSAINKA
mgnify:CR=1 FL=1